MHTLLHALTTPRHHLDTFWALSENFEIFEKIHLPTTPPAPYPYLALPAPRLRLRLSRAAPQRAAPHPFTHFYTP